MTKKEIARAIAGKVDVSNCVTTEIVQQVFDGIIEVLASEGRIELRNFGVFEVKTRKARRARNPRTGAKVDVPEKPVIRFKAGLNLKEGVRKLDFVSKRNKPER